MLLHLLIASLTAARRLPPPGSDTASWPPVRAPIPPKTACRSAAWHGRVSAGITVGDGVASSIVVVGVALIQGTRSPGSPSVPAARCAPAAQPDSIRARTARTTERARICRFNGGKRQELPVCLACLRPANDRAG